MSLAQSFQHKAIFATDSSGAMVVSWEVCWPGASAPSHAKDSSRAGLGLSIEDVLSIFHEYVNVSWAARHALCTRAEKG